MRFLVIALCLLTSVANAEPERYYLDTTSDQLLHSEADAWLDSATEHFSLSRDDLSFRGVFFARTPGIPPILCGEVALTGSPGPADRFYRFIAFREQFASELSGDTLEFDAGFAQLFRAMCG